MFSLVISQFEFLSYMNEFKLSSSNSVLICRSVFCCSFVPPSNSKGINFVFLDMVLFIIRCTYAISLYQLVRSSTLTFCQNPDKDSVHSLYLTVLRIPVVTEICSIFSFL